MIIGLLQHAVSFKKKTEDEWVTLNSMELVQSRPDDKFGDRVVEGWAISDTRLESDQEIMAFWMNPANDWGRFDGACGKLGIIYMCNQCRLESAL